MLPLQGRIADSRLWRDCRGEARLARRVRRTRIVIILYIYLRARRASPVKCAYGVLSVNISFAAYHEIIAHNVNIHVMRRRARHASPLQSLAEARLNTKQTNIIFAQIQRNNVIAI